MASLSFSYRSKKPKAFLEVRFAHRIEDNPNPISFYSRSKIEVENSYWKVHKKKTTDPIIQKKQNDLNTEMTEMRTFVLDRFEKTDIENVNKDWFLKALDDYYNPTTGHEPLEEIPTNLVDYVSFYLKVKGNEMTETSKRKYRVVEKRLISLEKHFGKTYEIKDVNDNFKRDFIEYYENEKYSKNTQHRALVFVKTLCKHARTKGIETHAEMDGLRIKPDANVPKIWLTFEDLEKLEQLKDLPEYLDNAKDWLIISCYTGQRVSDLLRFTSEMIREKQGNKLLEFTQQKTKRIMTIALHKKVLEILDKRNGEFPRSISDQRYNEYIKEVCKEAEINTSIKGRLKVNIAKDKDKKKPKKMRIKEGVFEKWELVSSHIGRRSFASNFYGIIPTTHLMNATGHKTEAMLLEYLGKSTEDLALETFKYF
ncbi:MAG: phage integrase SAM-like domain-containing protein [Aequorivita sp.]